MEEKDRSTSLKRSPGNILSLFVGSDYVYLCHTRCKRKSIDICILDNFVRSTLTKDTQCICRSFLRFVVILGFSHLCESGGSHISVSRLSSFLWSGSVNQKWHLVLSKACILSCLKKKCFAGAVLLESTLGYHCTNLDLLPMHILFPTFKIP